MLHMHVRDPKNLANRVRTTEFWFKINSKVQVRCPDIIINNTTSDGLDMSMCVTRLPFFGTVENVVGLLRKFPEDSLWFCSGIGQFQLLLTTPAILLGGHVRMSMDDNIYYRWGIN